MCPFAPHIPSARWRKHTHTPTLNNYLFLSKSSIMYHFPGPSQRSSRASPCKNAWRSISWEEIHLRESFIFGEYFHRLIGFKISAEKFYGENFPSLSRHASSVSPVSGRGRGRGIFVNVPLDRPLLLQGPNSITFGLPNLSNF